MTKLISIQHFLIKKPAVRGGIDFVYLRSLERLSAKFKGLTAVPDLLSFSAHSDWMKIIRL